MMQVTLVHVLVKEAFINDFIQACELNHLASVQEPGNCRFDILQSSDDPQRFVLYEAYTSTEAALAHKLTSHYLQWRATVADWMQEARRGDAYQGCFPASC